MHKRVSTASSAGVRLVDADRMSEPVRTALLGSDHESEQDALSRSVLHVPSMLATPTAATTGAIRRRSPSRSSSSSSGSAPSGLGPSKPRLGRRPLSARLHHHHQAPAPRPQLAPMTSEQEDAMRARAEEMVAASLHKSRAAWDGTKQIFDDPKQWKLHYAKTHVAIYRHRGPGPPPASLAAAAADAIGPGPTATAQHFVATGRIPGLSLADVEYGNYADTTLDERAACAYLYRDCFLDAAVLRVVDAQTDDDPFRFFGIKWAAVTAPRGHNFFSPRDMAFFEYAKTAPAAGVDGSGGRVLVKVVHSVDQDVVPAVASAATKLVRSAICMTTMFRYDAKTNAVQVFAEGWIDPCGRGSPWLGSAFLSHFVPPIVRIEHCADIKYIMKHGLVFPLHRGHPPNDDARASTRSGQSRPTSSALAMDSRPSWVPDHQRKVCFVCFKSFGLVRRHRHHCRMCGEVMCARCMIVLPLVAPAPGAEGGVEESASQYALQQQPARKELSTSRADGFPAVNAVKLCKKCMFNIRQERKGVVFGPDALRTGMGSLGFHAFGGPSVMMRQFPIVLHGTRAVAAGDELPYHPFPRPPDPYADDDDDDDDVDDETYSRRIEALRRAHLEKEKLKNARQSIKLYDEEDLRIENGEPTPKARPPGEPSGYNFDDLLLPCAGEDEVPERPHAPTANELFRSTLSAADAARRVSVTLLPPATPTSTPAPAPVETIQENYVASSDAATRAQRSLSIPDQLERVEKSIAQQGVLLQTLKMRASAVNRIDGQVTAASPQTAATAVSADSP